MGLKISPSASVSLRPEAKLTASLTNVATGAVLLITAGKGALFPTYGGGDYSYLTLYDAAGNVEVVKVTARSTDTLTIDAAGRGLDNTTARAWNVGDGVRLGLPPITLLEIARNPMWCGTAGGSADALTLTSSFPAIAYAASLPIEFIVASVNTSAVTVNLNTLGAKSLVWNNLVGLVAGDLQVTGDETNQVLPHQALRAQRVQVDRHRSGVRARDDEFDRQRGRVGDRRE